MTTGNATQQAVAEVLAKLEPLDVLEFLDYRPETIQRDGPIIRSFCPVHRDTEYRSLIIDVETGIARCAEDSCPAAMRVDMVKLVALARGMAVEQALELLIKEFNLPVLLPEEEAATSGLLDEAEPLVAKLENGASQDEEIRRDAAKRIAKVIKAHPRHLRALRLLHRLKVACNDFTSMASVVSLLAEVEIEAANPAEALRVLDAELTRNPGNGLLRRKYAGVLSLQDRVDEAVENLFLLAEEAEAAQDWELAIEAYRDIQNMGAVSGIDVGPMIAHVAAAMGDVDVAIGGLCDRARALIKKGDAAGALEAYESALDLHPEDESLLTEAARAALGQGVPRERVARFLRRLEVFDESGLGDVANGILNSLGGLVLRDRDFLRCHARIVANLGMPADALAKWRAMLSIAPADLEAMEQVLPPLVASGDNAQALDLLKSAGLQTLDRLAAQRLLALGYDVLMTEPADTEVLRARAAFQEAAGERSELRETLSRLTKAFEEAGNEAETLRTARRHVQTFPSDEKALRKLAALLIAARKTDEAIPELHRLARQLQTMGQRGNALEVLSEIVQLDPFHREAIDESLALDPPDEQRLELLSSRANVLIRDGEMAEATRTLREALALDPENVEARRLLIDVCRIDGTRDSREALDELDELARVFAARGEVDRRLSVLEEGVELAPDDLERREELIAELVRFEKRTDAAHQLIELAGMMAEAEEHEEALAALDRALDLAPGDPTARARRAELLEATGDAAGALAEWRALAPLLQAASSRGNAGSAAPIQQQTLVDEYDFDRFVVGGRNRFAWATAQAVSKAPGNSGHNPLFLHSEVGLGKTHILHAIGHTIQRNIRDAVVVYINAEDFVTELVDAIQGNTVSEFRERLRSCTALLIDDVHQLAGQERAQEEFFHIFNSLHQAKRQIVATSDRPPREIAHLEKRLLSRFGAGVIVDIQAPDSETRAAILKRAAAERGYPDLPAALIRRLADGIGTNVRELKAGLNQLLLFHEIGGDPLDESTVERVLTSFFGSSGAVEKPEGE